MISGKSVFSVAPILTDSKSRQLSPSHLLGEHQVSRNLYFIAHPRNRKDQEAKQRALTQET